MSKGSAPPPPDYTAAAQAQGAANVEAARQTGIMSNPNIYNPYGSQEVTFDPVTHQPTVRQNLSPVGQQQFDIQQGINTQLGGLAQTGLGYVEDTLSKPYDQSTLPASMINAGETGQEAIMRRLQPQLERQREQLDTQLYNRGITGGEAYGNAMTDQNQRENDLLSQAGLYGIDAGNKARSQAIQEQSFFRNEPLNMLNAVRSASPVNVPQFQNYQGTSVQAAPIMNATNQQYQGNLNTYNAQAGQQGNFMSGLFGLGSAALMSDIRLKSNIKRIGTHPLGVGIYEYDIFGERQRGVMAQELFHVKPDAVLTHPSGYLMVDYGQIGGRL